MLNEFNHPARALCTRDESFLSPRPSAETSRRQIRITPAHSQKCVHNTRPSRQILSFQHLHGLHTGQKYYPKSLGNIKFKVTDLNFVHDISVLSESPGTLVAALDTFTYEAKPLGLEVWTKAKNQNYGGLFEDPFQLVRVCSERI